MPSRNPTTTGCDVSDTMLHGVLLMPPELWTSEPIDVCKRHWRYMQASERIIEQEQEIERLRKDLDDALEALRHLRQCQNFPFVGDSRDWWAAAISEADAVLARFDIKATE